MNLKWTKDGDGSARAVLTALRAATGAGSASAAMPVDNWSTASLVYSIEKK
jgi:hypothetical protein